MRSYIITYSLGSFMGCYIFWRIWPGRPSDYEICAMIESKDCDRTSEQKNYLKSITKMGSPILFFNMMLNISSAKLKDFTEKYQHQPLRWLNIIYSSDSIAYPLKASLNASSIPTIFFLW